MFFLNKSNVHIKSTPEKQENGNKDLNIEDTRQIPGRGVNSIIRWNEDLHFVKQLLKLKLDLLPNLQQHDKHFD